LIHDNQCCVLAKNNATIEVLKSALDKTSTIDVNINSFITDPNCLELPSNQWFKLEDWAYNGLNLSQQKAIELAAS
jgi:hypothetical protein